MAPSLFNRYIWLTDIIYSAGQISKEDIDRKWSASALNDKHETRIARTTFQRLRNGIEEVFGLIIDCDRTTNLYYIANRNDIRNSATQQWLLNTFAVTNMVQESRNIQDKILLERMPSDSMYLTPIMEAIRAGKRLQMTYKKFLAAEPHTFRFSPYCLKTFKQRWYVAGVSEEHPDEVRVYGLDRVQNISLTDEAYDIPKSFDAEAFFYNYYGIWHDESIPPETVRIRVTRAGANYLRSLPLHHSQKELTGAPDGFVDFEYYIVPTFDFVQELRTHGPDLKVLTPAHLAERMKKEYRMASEQYE